MKSALFALAALVVSGSAFASEEVAVYSLTSYDSPVLSATFRADVKKGEAFILVSVVEDPTLAPLPSLPNGDTQLDPAATKGGVFHSDVKLSLDRDGTISYGTRDGNVACAKVEAKKFLGIKYSKVVPTGKCVFSTLLESAGRGLTKQTIEMEIK